MCRLLIKQGSRSKQFIELTVESGFCPFEYVIVKEEVGDEMPESEEESHDAWHDDESPAPLT